MNILIVVAHLRKGGPVDVIYNLCCQLLQHHIYSVNILTIREETQNSKIKDFQELDIHIEQLKLSRLKCELGTRSVTKQIQDYIDKNHIDLVHCHGYYPVLVCANLKKVRKASTLHDRATEDFINVYGKVLGKWMLYRYFKALNKFDKNIAVSRSAAELYENYISNTTYVNNGIDVNKFNLLDKEQAEKLKYKLGLPLDRKIFISTGRIEKEKRYEELTAIFNNVTSKYPIALLVLGDGEKLEYCQKLANNNRHIIFTGRVSNVAEYLQCSDYYISYSKSEGMSMAVCEGISCGLYPILSDIPSHRDAANDIDGYFFQEPKDINFDIILNKNIDKPYLHDYICNHFSIETMGKGYIKCYGELLKNE